MSAIEYQTYSDFKNAIQLLVAPEDLAENTTTLFNHWVSGALADIQTLLPWFREYNVNFYEKQDVNEFCAASIFQGPVGKITQLFAYKPGTDCQKFYYNKVSQAALDCWIDRQRCTLCNFTTPVSTNIYDSPYCNYVIGGAYGCDVPYLTPPEDDLRFRSLCDSERIFAVGPDYKVYAAPRFPCGYVLALQWQGVRRTWTDTDLVPVDQQLRDAVVDYIEHKQYMKEHQGDASEFFNSYAISLRMLRYRYQDEQDPEMKRDCSAAIEQLMSGFRPLYETSVYGPFGIFVPGGGTGGGTVTGGVIQVYTGIAPPTTPDDPTKAAIFYFSTGQMLVWDINSQTWI